MTGLNSLSAGKNPFQRSQSPHPISRICCSSTPWKSFGEHAGSGISGFKGRAAAVLAAEFASRRPASRPAHLIQPFDMDIAWKLAL
jgi:hypothetical protein